jgi:biotin---protein ligase
LAFVKACLTKLGLEVNDGKAEVPALTSLHLSSIANTEVTELLYSFGNVIEKEDGREYIKDEADTFHIKTDAASPDISALAISDPTSGDLASDTNGTVDYNKILKVIIPHEAGLPTSADTPRFNHKLYFSSLKKYQLKEDSAAEWQWGNVFMYGDVVTSTNTLLEKYAPPASIKFAHRLANFRLGIRNSLVPSLTASHWRHQHKSLVAAAGATSGSRLRARSSSRQSSTTLRIWR